MFSVPEHIQWSIRGQEPRKELVNGQAKKDQTDDQKQADNNDEQLKKTTVLRGNQPKKPSMGVPLRARGLTENDKGLFQFNSNKDKAL